MDNSSLFSDIERKYNLPSGYLSGTYQVESGSGKTLYNPKSGAAGPMQFIPSTARAYDLKDPYDLPASADAAARLAVDNRKYMQGKGIEDPSAAQLYLAHQQGAGGAMKLLNSQQPAGDLVGQRAVAWNGGNPQMTGSEFANQAMAKFPGAQPPQNQVASSAGGLFGRIFGTNYDAPASPVPFQQSATNVAMPQNIAMQTAAGLSPTAGGAPSFTAPTNQAVVADAAKAMAPAGKDFNFAGLGTSGLAMMAAGAPHQTWQPSAPVQAHRGGNVDFSGLLAAPAASQDDLKRRLMGLLA